MITMLTGGSAELADAAMGKSTPEQIVSTATKEKMIRLYIVVRFTVNPTPFKAAFKPDF
jgi:hypothetical protein